ncbi:hypothetical protein GCM10008967_11660 [Bacillus carboniphilus]|uniref:UvrD-like helicase C-terminal domain-containing protein n=1 Tax=Bacillus carboniphilus TaxID=86663 RepID=A0ABP3FSU3_9BACI
MNAANDILRLIGTELPEVEPVVRHGNKPLFHSFETEAELVGGIKGTLEIIDNTGYNTIAVIGKSEKECNNLYKLLNYKVNRPIQHLKENEEIKKGHLVIVPSYLSKGLEFDVVILISLNETYTMDEIDIKLLYVAMTRPMHQLYLFGTNKKNLLLDKLDKDCIEIGENG